MSNAPVTNRLYDGQNDFDGGVDSFTTPTDIQQNQVSWLYNMVSKGKNLRSRPGFDVVQRVGCGKAQGFALFQPTNGNMYMVFAISGKIYACGFPFTKVFQLSQLAFDDKVDFIVFKEALVAVDQFGKAITPYAVLMMQDGRHRAAYWDGSTARHLDPTPDGFYNPASLGQNETPIGLWMEWIGNRLWVAQNRQVFASDIFNPLKFTENQYLATGGSFQAMDGQIITGLKKTADNKQLLVFTALNTTSIFASNSDRASWATTPDFVSLWFPGVGCVSGKSITVHNGEIHWMSAEGWRMYNQVGTAVRTSKSGIASHEMLRSYENMSPFMQRCCAGSFGHYAMGAVPSGDILNHHIWVLDTSSSDLLNSVRPYAWQGVWTGIRPVEFGTAQIETAKRCFCISQDYDGFVRIWELFDGTGLDEGQRIKWFFDSRGHNFAADKQLLSFKRFLYMEPQFQNIAGLVDVSMFFRSEYSCFKNIGDFSVCADDCLTLDQETCLPEGELEDQCRYRRSKMSSNTDCNEGGSPYVSNVGNYFIARIIGTGIGGLSRYKMTGEVYEEPNVGECPPSDKECVKQSCCDGEPFYASIFENHDYFYYYGGKDDPCDIVLV